MSTLRQSMDMEEKYLRGDAIIASSAPHTLTGRYMSLESWHTLDPGDGELYALVHLVWRE